MTIKRRTQRTNDLKAALRTMAASAADAGHEQDALTLQAAALIVGRQAAATDRAQAGPRRQTKLASQEAVALAAPDLTEYVLAAAERWLPLSACQLQRQPVALRTPDGTVIRTRSWADLVAGIANWLHQQGRLTPEQCPVLLGRGVVPTITRRMPTRQAGQSNDVRVLDGGLYLYTKYGRSEIFIKCRQLVERCGLDADQFHVLPHPDEALPHQPGRHEQARMFLAADPPPPSGVKCADTAAW